MKTMCPPGFHHNGFVATHALGHMMYGYTLLVPMNQHIYYAHLASVRFEHSVCRVSLMTTYITLHALLVERSLVHWYQQCVTVHHVPKCMSCHKAIVVITGGAHCFHDYIYILRSSCFCEIELKFLINNFNVSQFHHSHWFYEHF